MGNPNDPTPQLVVDKLSEAAGIKTNQRYSVSKGIINLRKKLAIFYEKHWDVGLDSENKVIATIGSKEGFSHLCLGILGPGDVALTPAPYFPIHVYCPVIAGANVISVEMNDGNEVLLSNIDHMCRTVSPKPKVLILNFPHNPTAQTVELDFLEEIVKLANKYSFYVIHDFAYGLTTFDGYHAPSFLQAQGVKEVGVESITMSKRYNMAGWRIGFVVGNPDIIKVLASIKGYYDYGIFQAIQIATVIALRHCEENMKHQAVVYAKRRDCLLDGLNKAGWLIEKPRATMFVWAQIPELYRELGSVKFTANCIEKVEVAVAPGLGFGEEGEGYLRIAVVENKERLRQAVRQIKRAFPV